jgi:asparagine synthase (glutamine-hydrolysing)
MCGLVGFFDYRGPATINDMTQTINSMTATLVHRGPDDSGAWVDESAGIALGFRRLSILDLTPTGHQPMVSADGRYVLVLNGEVYNYRELRKELIQAGMAFRGGADTEVVLAAIALWGLSAAVRRFNGMFAFSIWDRQERQLTLVRDRIGIKPLYYGWMGSILLFGSELKALRVHPAFQGEIDRDALALYMRHNYIVAPYTIYKGVRKLTPGTYLTIKTDHPDKEATPETYWSARKVAEAGMAAPFRESTDMAVEELDRLLRASIRERMIADVPLGAFLSGGIDSSVVVALMQAQSTRPVKTFSIGFTEEQFNEAPYAKAVAAHLGTDHTELYVTPQQAMDVIPRLPTLYDEPFADSSQIPTFLVSELARQHVTVSLSGDGGDELFAGYNRYEYFWSQWGNREGVSAISQKSTEHALSFLFSDRAKSWAAQLLCLLPHDTARSLRWRMESVVSGIASNTTGKPETVYHMMLSHWQNPEDVVREAHEPLTPVTDSRQWAELDQFTHRMMFLDLISYLPDDILVKVDRASMGVSLEARVPLLDDHRVVEFAWRLPLDLKVRDGQTKWILRQVLNRYVPRNLVERPKMGFGVPIDLWLRGPLRDWAEDLLNESRLRQEGWFNPEPIREKWQQHLSGKINWAYLLWDVLMFQAWKDVQGAGDMRDE